MKEVDGVSLGARDLVCRVCGRTEHADRVVGGVPCLRSADSAGFVVDGAEVVFWGVCPDCRTADARH